jgi:N-carbamoyl-L-amino-acid hydrolase
VDQRHADARTLATLHAEAVAASEAIAVEEGTRVRWSPLFQIHPIAFDRGLIEAAAAVVSSLQGEDVRLPSGPLHDAAHVADAGIPTVMLFVRSKRGLSHTREEDTDEADLAVALRALWLVAARRLWADAKPR